MCVLLADRTNVLAFVGALLHPAEAIARDVMNIEQGAAPKTLTQRLA